MVDDLTRNRALRAIRERPLSADDLANLLAVSKPAARELVDDLKVHGYIAALAGAGVEATDPLLDDEPLTLTFRGQLHLNPIFSSTSVRSSG